jgi:hypothetical protein
MSEMELHYKVRTILAIITLSKNNELNYVLEKKAAKKITKLLLENMYNYNFTDHSENYKEYIKNIDDSLNAL